MSMYLGGAEFLGNFFFVGGGGGLTVLAGLGERAIRSLRTIAGVGPSERDNCLIQST
jgi:hypothetical protein